MIDPKTPVVIRRFDAARDRQSLRECVIDQQNYHRGIEPSWPDGDAIVRDYMAYLDAECGVHNGCIIMALCGEEALDFVSVVATTRGESPDDPTPFAWIHDLYVEPEHRRRGVASMLMAEAERFARGERAKWLRLGVLGGARSERPLRRLLPESLRQDVRIVAESVPHVEPEGQARSYPHPSTE